MKRIRMILVATAVTFALAIAAQQAPAAHHMPSVDEHVKMLAEKLDLTADQQAKIRPAIQEMTDSIQSTMNDSSLSPRERTEQHHAAMEKADKKVRTYLNDDQKKKLDDLEQQMHKPQDHAHAPSN